MLSLASVVLSRCCLFRSDFQQAPYPQDVQDPLASISFDHITVYYHRSYPIQQQARRSFTWTFYIGRRDFSPPRKSIIPNTELALHGINGKMESFNRKWESFTHLVVRPRT